MPLLKFETSIWVVFFTTIIFSPNVLYIVISKLSIVKPIISILIYSLHGLGYMLITELVVCISDRLDMLFKGVSHLFN
jgi:hypothetical protein